MEENIYPVKSSQSEGRGAAFNRVKIGLIGGSGLDNPKLLENYKEIKARTPYGKPSSNLTVGKLAGVEMVIIARHGKKHDIMPTKVPFRANLYALKEAGCSHVLATTACGSLREDIKPGDLVILDQFIDNTRHRVLTVHEDQVIHTPMAEPFCPNLRLILNQTAKKLKLAHQPKGTMVTIEGPRFSTRAESLMFRAWGADTINMSTVPEVILARELGLCYASVAMATDYDSWKEGEEPVTWEMIMKRMNDNVDKVKRLITAVLPEIESGDCEHCKQ